MKPEIARHEVLFEIERETGMPIRFAWAVLPTVCDREGRFKWRPRAMKADILPYDELNFADVLDVLLRRGFLIKYRQGPEWYGCIPTFRKHQHLNNKEAASTIPDPDKADEIVGSDTTRSSRETHALPTVLQSSPDGREGKGREGEGKGREGSTPLSAVTAVIDLWNALVTAPIPKVDKLTADRDVKIRARLQTYPEMAVWRTAITWINTQPWMRAPGTGDHPNWTATLDWLCKNDGNVQRCLERASTAASMPVHAPVDCPHVAGHTNAAACLLACHLGQPRTDGRAVRRWTEADAREGFTGLVAVDVVSQ